MWGLLVSLVPPTCSLPVSPSPPVSIPSCITNTDGCCLLPTVSTTDRRVTINKCFWEVPRPIMLHLCPSSNHTCLLPKTSWPRPSKISANIAKASHTTNHNIWQRSIWGRRLEDEGLGGQVSRLGGGVGVFAENMKHSGTWHRSATRGFAYKPCPYVAMFKRAPRPTSWLRSDGHKGTPAQVTKPQHRQPRREGE